MTNNSNPEVGILLSTYNGGQFLEAFLKSLLEQSYKKWKLIIRDDGSGDNTLDIIKKFSTLHSNAEIVLDDEKGMGPKRSFFKLATEVVNDTRFTFDYIMFADQDDIWKPQKIERTLNKMIDTVVAYPNLPCLVHTNLTLVSNDLKMIQNEMYSEKSFDDWKYLLLTNSVTGCTVMVNRILLKTGLKGLNDDAAMDAVVMHDWWFALIAECLGGISYIGSSTILYRQHGNNSVGATFGVTKKMSKLFNYRRFNDDTRKAVRQLILFDGLYNDSLPASIHESISTIRLVLHGKGLSGRVNASNKLTLRKRSRTGTIQLHVFLFLRAIIGS